MLTIKRVPTVLSNYQEDGNTSSDSDGITRNEAHGCVRNCLGKCCLRVSDLPLYAFKKSLEHDSAIPCGPGPPVSFLINSLLGKWEDRMHRGLFRYDVTTCETKVIPGRYGFLAQLNEGRHLKKRPTEFRIDHFLQPFDENKFNFRKVGQEEVLFMFEPSHDNESHFFPSYSADASSASPSVIAINVNQEILDTHVNPAVWEISGHIVLKRRKDYVEASEESAWKLLSVVSLTEESFQEVKACTFKAAELRVEVDDGDKNQEEGFCELRAPQVTSHLNQDCLVLH